MARYDAVAEWFDTVMSGGGPTPDQTMFWDLLGPGTGRCLDLGCGTGARAPGIQNLGWHTVGIDLSREELRISRASRRLGAVACADAAHLPVVSESLDAVVSLATHTDFDDWASAVREVQRVLRPGGTFVYAGVHPCFIGPFSELRDDGTRVLHEGYRDTQLRFTGPGIGDGIRSRVGVRHLPLPDLLNPVLTAGLRINKVVESPERTLPLLLAFRAERPT
ncbi:class I SAM-dependent methyltransferase [Actinopolymorpha sp. B17G11]|uniref:class I SAM-dependent methyltransferase n=1 Tax=Actinopolymorpha sp. B17G11 TaxID=3160861 RepID=UPI0032E444B0